MLVPVIIAGGSGVRLWPLSRALLPKQFMDFPGRGGSLFQETLRRLEGLERLDSSGANSSISPPLVVCNAEHRFLATEQLQQVGMAQASLLLEPCARNTAPAVALAALHALSLHAKTEPSTEPKTEPVLLVLPADHIIEQPEVFRAAVCRGMRLTQQSKLVTFGIPPLTAESGYGYIQRGDALGAEDARDAKEQSEAFVINRFTEKPDAATAQKYLDSGQFFWNSGMFMFAATRYLKELERFAAPMLKACRKAYDACDASAENGNFISINEDQFARCPSDSIDYAVMEKTKDGAVLPLDAGWSDVGSWDVLWQTRRDEKSEDKDAAGNMLVETAGKVMAKDVHNSYIASHSRLVAAVGVENLIVVETPDAILVAQKGRSQEVKDIVTRLQKEGREEVHRPHLVLRPWGSYEVLGKGEGYQVKHLTVEPGAALSLQKHKHRAERWTVIAGEAQVTCDKKQFKLAVGESTTIPQGSEHRLENPGKEPLRIVEVQTGDYLGEDDIVRLEDKYGRI